MLQLPDPPVNPLFQAFGVKTPNKYVFEILKRIKSRFVKLIFMA